MRYVIISDFFGDDLAGGGGTHSGGAELSDDTLLNVLEEKGEDVIRIKGRDVTDDFIETEENSFFILTNFFHVHPFLLEKIQGLKYLLYCHDYKFVGNMQPNRYPECLVPENELINVNLFKNAIAVICQSELQTKIHEKNLHLTNLINFSGNLWKKETLDLLEELSSAPKKNICSVIKSPYPEKGVPEAIKFCIQKPMDYELVHDRDHGNFLSKIAHNQHLCFWPLLPETCGRIAVEAAMMNCEVHTNELLGASHEPWFNLEGEELINVMRNKHNEIHNIITNL